MQRLSKLGTRMLRPRTALDPGGASTEVLGGDFRVTALTLILTPTRSVLPPSARARRLMTAPSGEAGWGLCIWTEFSRG